LYPRVRGGGRVDRELIDNESLRGLIVLKLPVRVHPHRVVLCVSDKGGEVLLQGVSTVRLLRALDRGESLCCRLMRLRKRREVLGRGEDRIGGGARSALHIEGRDTLCLIKASTAGAVERSHAEGRVNDDSDMLS
jgi:hypothetical protein